MHVVFVALNLPAIPLVVLSHPHLAPVAHGVVPRFPGGLNSTLVLLIVGIAGTTVAHWQLFFQRSNVIDKRITPRCLAYERIDTMICSVVVVLLCNDRPVLGPWANKPWLNMVIRVLVVLSAILCLQTAFPHVDVVALIAVVAVLGVQQVAVRIRRGRVISEADEIDRLTWRMPPLSELGRPVWSRSRKLGMLALRVYLALAMGMVAIKIVQLALHGTGHA